VNHGGEKSDLSTKPRKKDFTGGKTFLPCIISTKPFSPNVQHINLNIMGKMTLLLIYSGIQVGKAVPRKYVSGILTRISS